jgi:tetratricopeptide (TPR) repeat protein
MTKVDENWKSGRASLGAAANWTPEEMRLIADLGYGLAEQGRNEEAITIFEGLAVLAPATAYFQSALGALKLRTGNLEEAVHYLTAALAADPNDPSALTNRGEANLRAGKYQAAVNDLTRALRLLAAEQENHPSAIRARALLNRISGSAK